MVFYVILLVAFNFIVFFFLQMKSWLLRQRKNGKEQPEIIAQETISFSPLPYLEGKNGHSNIISYDITRMFIHFSS